MKQNVDKLYFIIKYFGENPPVWITVVLYKKLSANRIIRTQLFYFSALYLYDLNSAIFILNVEIRRIANPKSGPCPFFKPGDTFLLKRTPQQDDFYRLMEGKFCGEAWDAVSRYVYTALQGGSIMKGWTNDDRMMIACCNDGTRPVIFKIERIDIPENDEEREWLEKQSFTNTAEDAYTG